MNRLLVIGSGSSGNCYSLTVNDQTLVIDQGVSFKKFKIARDFFLQDVVGGVCSHEHKDHFGYTADFEKAGIEIYKPWIDKGLAYVQYGDFKIKAFPVPHDVECHGFYITSGDERIVYVTDAEYCEYNFAALKPTMLIVECNYQNEYVRDVTELRERIYQTHMELQTTKNFIVTNATDALRNVVLVHLSDVSTNEKEIYQEIKGVTNPDTTVYVASNGMVIDI